MPKLGQYETEKLYLPSTKDLPEGKQAYVVVRKKIFLGDLGNIEVHTNGRDRTIETLVRLIEKWNYTDNGEPVSDTNAATPITFDTVKKIEREDFWMLAEWVDKTFATAKEGVPADQKKTLSDTSLDSETSKTTPAELQPTTIPIVQS